MAQSSGFSRGKLSRHGGARPGAGRKPGWLADKCQEVIDKHKLYDWLGSVAAGLETEERITKDGVVRVGACVHDRLKALEMLMDRAHGKAQQAVEVSGHDNGPIKIVIENVTTTA